MAIPNGIRLRHLEAFLAVCEGGTISGAAKVRHISQPALSKTIGELEKLLDVTLFNRVGRQTIPTAEGEIFRRHALDSLRSLDAGCGALSGTDSASRVKVGVLPTVIGGFFPDVARDFSARRPDVSTSIFTGPNGYLIDLLRSGQIDLMVGRMPASKDMPGLSFEYLYEEPISLVARPGHPMAKRSAAEAVQTCPLILPNTGAIIRGMVEEFLHSVGVQKFEAAFETVSLPFARNLLERSDMLWFISRGVVARELDHGDLVSIDMGERILSGAVGLTRRLANADNPDLDYLIQLLHRKAESGI
jgi:LysR family pca operon transcriptional activator